MPDGEQASGTFSYALVRIGTLSLAIPGELLSEAVPGPIDLAPFPEAPWHVLGAFNCRGHAIPVIDLGTLVQPAAVEHPLRPVAYALVLRHPDGAFAVQVDEVTGIVPATAGTITVLTNVPGNRRPLFKELYTPANGGRPHVILDLDAILSVEGVRSAVLRSGQKETTQKTTSGVGEPYTLFKAAGVLFALETSCLKRLLAGNQTLDTPFRHEVLRGFLKHEGEDVPVLDTRALLSLPPVEASKTEAPLLMIVQGKERLIALEIEEVLAMPRLDRATFHALDEAGVPHSGCYAGGTTDESGHPVLVLETEAFLTHATLLQGKGRAEAKVEVVAQHKGKKSVLEDILRHFIIFRAGGGRLACELSELDSVICVPTDYTVSGKQGQELLGLCTRQGQTVKLLSLARLLGKGGTDSAGGCSALVVKGEDGLVGYVVDAVDFLQHAQRQELPASRSNGIIPGFTHTVRVRNDGSDFAACVIELKSLTPKLASLLR